MPQDPQDWSRRLRTEWEERARSPLRRFYIASHPGWKDSAAWARQAEIDAEFAFHGLPPDWLERAHALDLGCGIGRMAPHIAARVRSYTGVDIVADFVEEARREHAGLETARFLVGDGLTLPAEARDREYLLILCLAVFIHCPGEVIARNVDACLEVLGREGRLRFALLADPSDPTGIVAPDPPAASAHWEDMQESIETTVEELVEAGDEALVNEREYRGEVFGYDLARDFLSTIAGERAEVHLLRLDPAFIFCDLRRLPLLDPA